MNLHKISVHACKRTAGARYISDFILFSVHVAMFVSNLSLRGRIPDIGTSGMDRENEHIHWSGPSKNKTMKKNSTDVLNLMTMPARRKLSWALVPIRRQRHSAKICYASSHLFHNIQRVNMFYQLSLLTTMPHCGSMTLCIGDSTLPFASYWSSGSTHCRHGQ